MYVIIFKFYFHKNVFLFLVIWLATIAIIANYLLLRYTLTTMFLVNIDLAIALGAISNFLQTGLTFCFTLLLVGLVYNAQLNVLNGRFNKLVNSIKTGQLTSGRYAGSGLAYHWVSHRQLMVSIDAFNDLLSPAAASVMAFVTPYNIFLLTAIFYTNSTSEVILDKVGLVTGLAFQVLAISFLAGALCYLVDQLHLSVKPMHGLQLWLRSDKWRWPTNLQINDNDVCELQLNTKIVVALQTKWKLLTHYEIVHTNAKHFFTIGTMVLSKKSCFDVSIL